MIETALFLDVLAVVVCASLLWRYGRLSHSHPAAIYFFFHTYTITTRLWSLSRGAPTLFTLENVFETVTLDEIVRAAFMADVALIAMTAAWIKVAASDRSQARRNPSSKQHQAPNLSIRHIAVVVAIAFPIGIASLAASAFLPGVVRSESFGGGELAAANWIAISQAWVGLSLLALMYYYGFRWWLVLPMVVYLLVMGYQGYHRFRVIIPAILMMQIYLDRHRLRWPPARFLAVLVILTAVFYPLKSIGRMAQDGRPAQEIVDVVTESIVGASSGEAPDQQFLDQYAAAITLMDRAGRTYYGSTYLPLITLPIPRQLWPEKPGLADHVADFSTPSRPMDQMGMIITFWGESYANFGYLGLIIVPYLLAYWLALIYFRAYRSNYYTVTHFAYLLIACNLIQVYRDGIVSLVVFVVVNMMPLAFIVLLHYVAPAKSRKAMKRSVAVPSAVVSR